MFSSNMIEFDIKYAALHFVHRNTLKYNKIHPLGSNVCNDFPDKNDSMFNSKSECGEQHNLATLIEQFDSFVIERDEKVSNFVICPIGLIMGCNC